MPVPSAVEDSIEELRTENGLLKNELRSLNSEMSLLLHRTKGKCTEHRLCPLTSHCLPENVAGTVSAQLQCNKLCT